MQPDADIRPRSLALTRKTIVIALVVLAAYQAIYLVIWLSKPQQPPFDDFFALWSFGKFAATAGPKIYHPVALQAFQRLLDPAFHRSYPCPYPPEFLLALVPLGQIPLTLAYLIWVAGTLLLYVIATLGRSWRSLWGVALLVAPTTLLTIVAGQNGFLSAALLVGGLRSLKRSPVAGGTPAWAARLQAAVRPAHPCRPARFAKLASDPGGVPDSRIGCRRQFHGIRLVDLAGLGAKHRVLSAVAARKPIQPRPPDADADGGNACDRRTRPDRIRRAACGRHGYSRHTVAHSLAHSRRSCYCRYNRGDCNRHTVRLHL